jgi:hypothetical protein
MPNFDFDAALRAHRAAQGDDDAPEPVTFHYGGQLFTVLPSPTLGDVIELAYAPEPTPETEEQAAFVALQFVRRLLPREDRPRFDQAHYTIEARKAAPAILELVTWITQQVTGFPTEPPAPSPPSASGPGPDSRGSTGGPNRSSRRRPGKESGSSTTASRAG